MGIDDDAGIAGLELGERRTLNVDLVREHPQMSRAQARVLAALEVQRRIGDFIDHARFLSAMPHLMPRSRQA